MKNRTYLLNTILAAVVGIAMLAIMLLHTFLPAFIIPKLTLPNLMLLSLIALVLDHYLAKGAQRCYICIPVFALITFGLLPWASGMFSVAEAVSDANNLGKAVTVVIRDDAPVDSYLVTSNVTLSYKGKTTETVLETVKFNFSAVPPQNQGNGESETGEITTETDG